MRPARVLQQALLRLHWWSCRPAAAAAASEVNQSHRHAVMVSGYVDIMICRCHYMSMWWYCDMSIWWFVDMMIQNRDNDFWLNMKNQFHFVCSVCKHVCFICVAEVVIIPYHRSRRQHMAVSSWFVYAPVCDCVVCSFVQFSNDVIDDEYWCWYWWWWW